MRSHILVLCCLIPAGNFSLAQQPPNVALSGPLATPDGPSDASTVPSPEASAAVGFENDAEGFVQLLDGKTLNGWSGSSNYWSVNDGALTGVTDGSLKTNQFITWKGSTVRNFDSRDRLRC